LYTVTIYIYRVGFSDTDPMGWVIFDYVVDFMFFIDCLLTFITCYYTSGTELEVNYRLIALNYLKSWFALDIVGFFPFEAFANSTVGNAELFSAQLKPFYRLLRLLKLVRLVKLWNNPLKNQELSECLQLFHVNFNKMHILLVTFILYCHTMCCLWCMLPRASSGHRNWEVYYNSQDDTDLEKYIAGFYWIITTVCTIGFGDIVPRNTLEIAYAICVMSSGVFFYSYTISAITSFMAANNLQNSRIEEYTKVLQGIVVEFKLNKGFHRRLSEALVYNLKEKRLDFATLLNSLPPKVASTLKYAMNHKLLEHNDFFKDKPYHFVQKILEYLMPYKVDANEFIYKEGSPCDEIYFLLSGEVVFVYDNDIIYESVTAGGYFGDAELFLCEERETTVKSIKRTKMLTLDRELLLSILKDYEKLKVDMIIMSMIKRKQLKKTSIMSNSSDSSEDVHISPLQLSFPDKPDSSSENVSVKFIEDCSSSLEPRVAWE
jgi:CRP-like cAMP-binding protein